LLPSQLLTVKVLRRPVESAQGTAIRFGQRLADAGIQPSMGSVGDSFDSALAENFFSTLKVELVYRTSWRTHEEAELALMLLWLSSGRDFLFLDMDWRCLEELEQPAGEVALQAALDLPWRLALGGAAGDVGARLGVVGHARQHDRVQGPVELPVTAAVEAVADDLARRRLDGRCPAEHGEGGLRA
jgi:hypothetical protein